MNSTPAQPPAEQGQTPRTDAETSKRHLYDSCLPWVAFAKQLESELAEAKRLHKEQFDLYCAETKRHNETWAQIHAATAYMDKECQKLPDGLLSKVKEVFFRMTLVEMGRDSLKEQVSNLTQQLAALAADKERLDWLENVCHAIEPDAMRWGVVDSRDGKTYFGDDLRAAIDLAREQGKGGV